MEASSFVEAVLKDEDEGVLLTAEVFLTSLAKARNDSKCDDGGRTNLSGCRR
jgi:hypothetical protein